MEYCITLLGTGTSIGIPVPGCRCRVCLSPDPRNRRSRCSMLIESGGTALLIDTAPEFRLQALKAKIGRLDAVFWTHAHADHLHGLDDLRALCWKKAIPGYAARETVVEIKTRFDYLWKRTQGGGGRAKIDFHVVDPNDRVSVGSLDMIPIPVVHGRLPVYGWRCGPVAYITDASMIPDASYALLKDLEILIMGALRFKVHPTHFNVDRALEEIKKIRPKRAYLTHISHEVSHGKLLRKTPRNVSPARDGLRIRVEG